VVLVGLKPISVANWLHSVLWRCWLGHLTCKNRPRNDSPVEIHWTVFCLITDVLWLIIVLGVFLDVFKPGALLAPLSKIMTYKVSSATLSFYSLVTCSTDENQATASDMSPILVLISGMSHVNVPRSSDSMALRQRFIDYGYSLSRSLVLLTTLTRRC